MLTMKPEIQYLRSWHFHGDDALSYISQETHHNVIVEMYPLARVIVKARCRACKMSNTAAGSSGLKDPSFILRRHFCDRGKAV